jgi:hypothetical protein
VATASQWAFAARAGTRTARALVIDRAPVLVAHRKNYSIGLGEQLDILAALAAVDLVLDAEVRPRLTGRTPRSHPQRRLRVNCLRRMRAIPAAPPSSIRDNVPGSGTGAGVSSVRLSSVNEPPRGSPVIVMKEIFSKAS